MLNQSEQTVYEMLTQFLGATRIVAPENKHFNYCENVHNQFPNQTLIFTEAGVGKRWLTLTGLEHRIEFLVYFPNGKRVYIDSKYLSSGAYLYNGHEQICDAGKVDADIIFIYFGDVIKLPKFQKFITDVRCSPNVKIYNSLEQLQNHLSDRMRS